VSDIIKYIQKLHQPSLTVPPPKNTSSTHNPKIIKCNLKPCHTCMLCTSPNQHSASFRVIRPPPGCRRIICSRCRLTTPPLAEWWRRRRTQITRSRVMGGCKSLMLFFGGFFFVFGDEDSRLCFCFFTLRKKRGGNVYGICHGRQRPNAI